MAEAIRTYQIVGASTDTWILNVKSAREFPAELAEQLDGLKAAIQEYISRLLDEEVT